MHILRAATPSTNLPTEPFRSRSFALEPATAAQTPGNFGFLVCTTSTRRIPAPKLICHRFRLLGHSLPFSPRHLPLSIRSTVETFRSGWYADLRQRTRWRRPIHQRVLGQAPGGREFLRACPPQAYLRGPSCRFTRPPCHSDRLSSCVRPSCTVRGRVLRVLPPRSSSAPTPSISCHSVWIPAETCICGGSLSILR